LPDKFTIDGGAVLPNYMCAEHPAVRIFPVTGKKALCIGAGAKKGARFPVLERAQ
jgi:hypothetical protein